MCHCAGPLIQLIQHIQHTSLSPLPSITTFWMIGFQCSATISQSCIGRTLFPSAPTHQTNSGFHSRPSVPASNLVDYFQVNGDGLRLSWAHAANSRAKLNAALRGSLESGELIETLQPIFVLRRWTDDRGRRESGRDDSISSTHNGSPASQHQWHHSGGLAHRSGPFQLRQRNQTRL